MLRAAKRTIRKLLPNFLSRRLAYYRAYKVLFADERSYLRSTGWLYSVEKGQPLGVDNEVLPWMNYPVISFLKERLNSNMDLFEFGCGYSTLFYAQHAKSVVSVEHDRSWYDAIKKTMPPNANLIFCEADTDGKYCQSIRGTNKLYDVVIVDGKDRVNCIRQSLDVLSESGVLILDDSQRPEYADGFIYAAQQGFRFLTFEGMKPNGGFLDKTTVMYKSGNCLGL